MKSAKIILMTVCLMSLIAACKKKKTEETPTAPTSQKQYWEEPSNFVSGINNPYFPLTPGDTFFYSADVYEDGDTGKENITMAVTHDTKVILGITCIVVHDVGRDEDYELLEDTYDWYAQDIDGNVWYFGEDTKAYDSTFNYSTEGSWTAGIDGAIPGIIMYANPKTKIGVSYRQEYYANHAEDQAMVIDTGKTVTVPYGTFSGCVVIQEFTRLEPGILAYKYYAPGVGEVYKIADAPGLFEEGKLIDIRR